MSVNVVVLLTERNVLTFIPGTCFKSQTWNKTTVYCQCDGWQTCHTCKHNIVTHLHLLPGRAMKSSTQAKISFCFLWEEFHLYTNMLSELEQCRMIKFNDSAASHKDTYYMHHVQITTYGSQPRTDHHVRITTTYRSPRTDHHVQITTYRSPRMDHNHVQITQSEHVTKSPVLPHRTKDKFVHSTLLRFTQLYE